MLDSYRYSYFAFTIMAALPALFLFGIGVYNYSFFYLTFWGSTLILLYISFLGIKSGNEKYFWPTFIIIGLIWFVLFLRTIERVLFVIENQGIDRIDGYGSPLAFMIGFVFEQIYFLPAFAVVIFGLKSIFYKRVTNAKTP